MQDFNHTVGFITGGANGIGLAVARALGHEGMALMLADIEEDTLNAAAAALRLEGIRVETAVLDVSDHAAYQQAAAHTLDTFGKVNFLFNNAGVATFGHAGGTAIEDWRWVIDVNVMGVAHGVEIFLPRMLELGEPCHILNTASIAGHVGNPGMGPYCASKFAVVGYTETLRTELVGSNVGVAVLCPAWVKTRIADSRRNHPAGEDAPAIDEHMGGVHDIIAEQGISVEAVAERVVAGIRSGSFNLFTHPDFWPLVDERLSAVRADYESIL